MKLSFFALTFSFAIFFQAYGQIKEAAQNIEVKAGKMSSATPFKVLSFGVTLEA